ncbi:MAG TPA: hypothetical protein VE775_04230, partial [Pyrinomonadaceae bacterium]|nr:hypothetical protein [Pyrinomonadaceae bacterium]
MRKIHSLRAGLGNVARALAFFGLCALTVHAQAGSRTGAATPEQRTARHFETLRKSPPQMLAFLLQMPKGGDLHSHLSGAVYAESFIQWAADKGLCVQQMTMTLSFPPCRQDAGQVEASAALRSGLLYRQMIDAWSMRYWQFSGQNGHDHFFDTFGKFGAATVGQTGAMLAEVAERAARGHVSYLELMLTPDNGLSGLIGQKVGLDSNSDEAIRKRNQALSALLGEDIGQSGEFQSTFDKLKDAGIAQAADVGAQSLRDAEAEKARLLKCGTPSAAAGCAVTIRYIAQVSRGSALSLVFAQMATGFALANDPTS